METKNHDSVIPATNPNGSDLNARSAARRAKGRKPDVTQVSSVYRLPGAAGLQNTSLYSALRASLRLFKFNPIEFSPAYAGMTG